MPQLTSEQIAQLSQKYPGFASLPYDQQQALLNRLQPQVNKPDMVSQLTTAGAPIAAQTGLNAILSSGAPTASSFAPSGTLTIAGKIPAAGATATPAATPAVSTNPGLAGILAGTHTGIQQFEGAKKISEGKKTSLQEKAALYPITGGIDTIAEKLGLSIGGGKSSDQKGRDKDRAILKQGGILDDKYNLTLSDGSKVNLGLDGSVKNYNVDFNEKGIGDIVALVNPFAYLISGGDQKRASDLAGQLTNAIKGTKNPAAEAKALFEKAGLFREDALSRIDQLKVDDQTKNVFKGTINKLGLSSAQQGQTQGNTQMPGFNLVIQRPVVQQPKPVNPVNAFRTNILQGMLQDTQKPIQYPSQNPDYKQQDFSSTLQKIMGV